MQGDRSIVDSFPETIDLNQGTNASVDTAAPWDNFLNPVEDRLPNPMLSSTRENPTCANAIINDTHSFGGWDRGESSSSTNLHEHGHDTDLKIGHGWPSSSSVYGMTNPKLEERRFEPFNAFLPGSSSGYGGNNLISSTSSLSNLALSHGPVNASLGGVYDHPDTQLVMRRSLSPTFHTSRSRLEEERRASGVSYNVGTSSGSSNYCNGTPDISGSSMGHWGLSCKRKAFDGCSRPSCGGSSSSNAALENILQHNCPSQNNAPSRLCTSPASVTAQNANGVGTRVSTNTYPSLSYSGVAEAPVRNFGGGLNLGNQDTVTFGLLPASTNSGNSSVGSTLAPPRLVSVTSSSDSRQPNTLPTDSRNTGIHCGAVRGSSVPRGLHPAPWNTSPNFRDGCSSSPNMVSGNRYTALQDEANFRSLIRENGEPLPVGPAPQTRNMIQDPTNWSLGASNASYARDTPSTSALGRGTSAQVFPAASMPNQNSATSSSRDFSEFAPWTLLPPVESESGSRRGQLSQLQSPVSSMEEVQMSSRSSSRGSRHHGNHQLHLRSTSMANIPGSDVDGWRGLAADIESRQRLLRQVLHAMRRVDSMRSEDYSLFDPFVNGLAELHDRHREMRLDVDNMSYEELLALEERIGTVNTGLSEETILCRMTQRKHEPACVGPLSNLEPCCICREEYKIGDDIGMLDCGHEYHSGCIKQWLMLKNLCPICKLTALQT